MSSNQNNIIPRDCLYKCNTRIYWDTNQNAYFEVFTRKKHICPNRVNKSTTTTTAPATTNRPTYYNKFEKHQSQRCLIPLNC